MDYSDIERVFEIVEDARARQQAESGFQVGPVTQEEKAEAYRWANGQELQHFVNTPGYEIVMNYLSSYVDDGIKTLFQSTVPTDKDAVLANFAIGYAACDIVNRLKQDLQADLEAAKSMPEIIRQGLRITKGIPVNATHEA